MLAVLKLTENLRGLDSLASTIGMPAGVPIAVMGFEKAGAINAALHAADRFVESHPEIAAAHAAYYAKKREEVIASNQRLQGE